MQCKVPFRVNFNLNFTGKLNFNSNFKLKFAVLHNPPARPRAGPGPLQVSLLV